MKSLKLISKPADKSGNGSLPAPWTAWNDFFENPFRALKAWGSGWPWGPAWTGLQGFKEPAIDVSENEKEVTVKAEVPGLSDKDLELSHADGMLYIKGEKKEEKEEKNKNTWHRESWQGSFSRGIPLGQGVDWNKIDAKYKDGVLTVNLPKVPGKENRVKVQIQ